jgi:hypothetical protein
VIGRGWIVSLVAVAACVQTTPPLDETTSLAVALVAPADPGTPDRRLPDTARMVTVTVTAKDAQNQVDTSVTRDVDVYVQFLATLTPELGSPIPFDTVTLTNGVSAPSDMMLPVVFGATTLWIEDATEGGTYPTGISPTLWYRDPFIADVSTPRDLAALDALTSSPLQNKQVSVRKTRYGSRGRLVITGTYAQGYSLSDVQCADDNGTPPCVSGDFDHVLVFSFSSPKDENRHPLEAGQFTDGFAGGVSEFNGLTEISFPQTFAATTLVGGTRVPDTSVDVNRIPAPAVVQTSWFTNTIEFEKHESGLIELDGGTVCPLDADYTTFKQWKVDIGLGCAKAVNVITAGTTTFNPATKVGMVIPKVIGVLRPVNVGSFNVFIMYPRTAADLQL